MQVKFSGSRQELAGEVERLRLRVRQHEHTLSRLADAVLTLRRGTEALREENRELRLALDAERRLGRGGRRRGAAA